MKSLEYSKFATFTITLAQILSGIIGALDVVIGLWGLFSSPLGGLMSVATGVVFFGIFFALARVVNLKDEPKE